MTVTSARLHGIATERFGYDRLLRGQEEELLPITGGRDALVVMPTGAGKSAIYQIAALVLDVQQSSSHP